MNKLLDDWFWVEGVWGCVRIVLIIGMFYAAQGMRLSLV